MNDETTKVFQSEGAESAENNNKTRKVAVAAGVAAGAMGLGGAAGYAATLDTEEKEDETANPELETPEPQPEPEPQVVERVVVREVHTPEPEEPAHNEITYDVDNAEVQVIEVGSTGEGGYYATAQVDGHAAVFVDGNGDGVVDVLGIDVNNNGQLEDNEVMDVSDRGVAMHDLAMAASPQSPAATTVSQNHDNHSTNAVNEVSTSEIQVTHVEHDVEMNGNTVDVATIDYRGHAGMAVDVDQNGRADIVAIDLNDNNRFEDGEFFDAENSMPMNSSRAGGTNVADPEPMPEPEPEPMPGTEDLPDYTSDGNVDGYII